MQFIPEKSPKFGTIINWHEKKNPIHRFNLKVCNFFIIFHLIYIERECDEIYVMLCMLFKRNVTSYYENSKKKVKWKVKLWWNYELYYES